MPGPAAGASLPELRSVRALPLLAAIAAIYFATGHLGLRLGLVDDGAAAVWPPAGVALAAFLLGGRWIWPAVLAGAYFVALSVADALTSLGLAAGDTLEGLAGAWLAGRFAGGWRAFERPRDVFRFAALVGLASAAGASAGTASLWLGGYVPGSEAGWMWLKWWIGHAVGALVVAPPILLWATRPRPRWEAGRALEAALWLGSLLALGALAFGGVLREAPPGLGFLALPILLWAAFRLEAQLAATASALLSTGAVWGALRQAGTLVDAGGSLPPLQAFLAVGSLGALVAAASVLERQAAEEELRRLQQAVETIDLGVTISDLSGRILYTNPAEAALHGYEAAELVGKDVSCFRPEGLAPAPGRPAEIRSWKRETLNRRRDGTLFPVQLVSDAVRDREGRPRAIVTCTEEISERRRSEDALRASEERYRLLFERNLAGVYRATVAGRLLECNAALVRMLGYSSMEELLLRTAWDLFHERREREASLARLRETGAIGSRELQLRRKDGGSVWVLENETLLLGDDGVERVAATLIDITERKEFEQRIAFRAYHDALTGLPNRALMAEQLERLLSQARWSGRGLAVLFLDLDDFKIVNDERGHAAGDRLLQEAAQRLRDGLRGDDAVARVGGDEFVLLLPQVRPDGAARIAEKVLAAMRKPFRLEGRELRVTASIGIAHFPQDGSDAETLLKAADDAMYRAKQQRGKSAYQMAGSHPGRPATKPA